MKLLVNAVQMKAADQYTIQELGIASLELMERAANACVQTMQSENLDLSSVCVVCGSGNNGGDGFAIARILKNMGFCGYLSGRQSRALYTGDTGTDKTS